MKIGRFSIMVTLAGLLALAVLTPQTSRSKSPSWAPSDHPRLIASPAEKETIIAKLTASGTVSAKIWNAFRTDNFIGNTRDYADGAFLYWITGDTAAGQSSIANAQSFINAFPNGLSASGSSFDERWYRYIDLLLTYDFAYDLLTAQQKTDFKNFIALQGALCSVANPGYAPGNANTLWMFCEYGSAMLLEGEGLSITVTDEAVVHGSSNGGDPLRYSKDGSNFKITNSPGQPTADYSQGADYTYSSVTGCYRCINWAPGGNEPAVGATYYVSYTFTPDVATWKSTGRAAIENHLNYQWRDGYYNGDLNPYGNLVAELLPFFFEMLKRDTGIDYSRNDDVKRLADMYLYSKLPSTPVGVTRRFNTINDTSDWSSYYGDAWTYPAPPRSYTYKAWLRPFVAWATTAYANDSEGYGNRYVWLWTKAYRNLNGTVKYTGTPDWREALWINDSAIAPYFGASTVPSATWPTVRYFRGKEVIYARTDDWNLPDPKAALMSVVSGNHNYLNEHDQGDAGSFTFFSNNQDWAIDPGYADESGSGLNLYDHNSVGIDSGGYNISGLYSAGGTSALGAFAHFNDVALTPDASAAVADLTHAWSQTSTPYLQRDFRYAAMVNGDQSGYLVVADDIQKDAGTHSYEWYLHTGIGNTVTISGNQATVTGNRGGAGSATMGLYSLGPEAVTLTQSTSSVGNLGDHQRLVVKAQDVTEARFLHLLIPATASQPPPTVSSVAVPGGTQALVSWTDGTVDTVLWRYDGNTITSSNNIVSDAKLTIVRALSGRVTGLIAMTGRAVTKDGANLLSVRDGAAPVTVSAGGPTAGLYATDAAKLTLGLPYVTNATLEDGTVPIPVYNDGANVWINGGLPLNELRRNNGLRYHEDFDDNYSRDLFRFNISKHPAEQFGVVNGSLELRETIVDWPSFSKRDSTPWRRADIFPTVIPPLDHGDAVYSFRYRFSDASAATKKFRVYLRTNDRNPVDWSTNQDYLRLELNAADSGVVKNEVTLGQRVNGSWASISNNDILTATIPTVTQSLNDTNWHNVSVRLLGDAAKVTFDGLTIIDATLPALIPTAPSSGYIQWRVVGSSPVLLDDVKVEAIDQTPPVTPSTGGLAFRSDSTGTMNLIYGHGSSPDSTAITLYESTSPIDPATNPVTLTPIAASTSSLTSLAFSGGDKTKFYAASVKDLAGNESPLLPLTVDNTPPATIFDLTAR
ncbi:MAG: DUF4815 domain-containing protein [Candidatus Kerfeldbacteria bacterium]|nr:DUF4815 domain-containing protein [Candidatus Kerfeldbacteria bacterium]